MLLRHLTKNETLVVLFIYVYSLSLNEINLHFFPQDNVIYERLAEGQEHRDETLRHLEQFASEGKKEKYQKTYHIMRLLFTPNSWMARCTGFFTFHVLIQISQQVQGYFEPTHQIWFDIDDAWKKLIGENCHFYYDLHRCLQFAENLHRFSHL